MRYFATDAQTRAQLFKALVLQLQNAQTSIEGVLHDLEVVREENQKLTHVRDEAEGLQMTLAETRARIVELEDGNRRLRDRKRQLEDIITSCQVWLQRILQIAPLDVKPLVEEALQSLYKQRSAPSTPRRPLEEGGTVGELVRGLSEATPPRLGAALAVEGGFRRASSEGRSPSVTSSPSGSPRTSRTSRDDVLVTLRTTEVEEAALSGPSPRASSSSFERRPSRERHGFLKPVPHIKPQGS